MLTPEKIDELLQETSRTFALAVPLLRGQTRVSVGLAYLMFRVADTLEDAASWTPAERKAGLERFAAMVDEPTCDRAVIEDWVNRGVTDHAGYKHLMTLTPELLDEVARLPRAAAAALRRHTKRTALGMRDMIDPSAAGLKTIEQLREYCYIVAGIVGELLTELFVEDAPALATVKDTLVANERAFGEGLQLVNILKDELGDREEGRSFLPPGVGRDEVIDLAIADLAGARRYIEALEQGNAPASFVAFTSLPWQLAQETLAALRVEGPGAKVPRARVMELFQHWTAVAQG